MRTDTWSGVWPGVDSSHTVSSSAWSLATSVAWPASSTGSTLSSKCAIGVAACTASQWCSSRADMM